MNCIGTERQRAVIAALKIKPDATRREIADAAGVSLVYAGLVVRDYLESKSHEKAQSCQLPARRAPMAVSKDVAAFHHPDRHLDPTRERVSSTAKQQAVNAALMEHARQDGEGKMAYCIRIAAIAGVSWSYVNYNLQVQKCARIGAERRAKEAEEAKFKVAPLSLNARAIGPMPAFQGWADVFNRFKLLTEMYLKLARARQDAYAESFLQDLHDHADRAETRSWIDQSVK